MHENKLLPLILSIHMGVGLVNACRHVLIRYSNWNSLAGTGLLVGFWRHWLHLKARAVSFSLATASAATTVKHTNFFKDVVKFYRQFHVDASWMTSDFQQKWVSCDPMASSTIMMYHFHSGSAMRLCEIPC